MFDILIYQLKHNYILVLKYVALVLIMGSFGLIAPFLSGIFMDHIISDFKINVFIGFVCAIAMANLAHMLFRYFRVLIATKLDTTLTYKISYTLFQKIFSVSCREMDNIDNAFLIDQISKDSHTVVRFFSSNIIEFFLQSLTIVISAIFIFRVDILLSFIIFSLIPLYIITFLRCKRTIHIAKSEYKQAINEYFSRYAEQINKLHFIKRNSLAPEMGGRLHTSFKKMLGASLKTVQTDYVFANANQFFIVIAYICITAIGGYRVGMHTLSIGFFSIINTYFNMIIHSISYFLGLASTYQEAKISFERINKVLSLPDEQNGSFQIPEIKTVQICDLSIHYNEQWILRQSNFQFEQGKIYGIIGQNGCGKTTFLNTLIGLCAGEYSGNILYNGFDIATLDMKNLRRERIAYQEQEPVMLNMTVREYLSFGIINSPRRQEEQFQLLELWDAKYLLDRSINENGANLSGGEKKKLALTRVLSKACNMIVLDEPTSALDNDGTLHLIDFLQKRKPESIVIVTSHDPAILNICDQVIELCETQMRLI